MLSPAKTDSASGRPTDHWLTALRLVAEQTAIPRDQLARFLKLEAKNTAALISRLENERLIRSERFLAGEPSWLWLTRKGVRLSQTDRCHRTYPPQLPYLRHRRAVNEVRLHLERREPNGRWHSETAIQGTRPKGAQIPDGLFEVAGERHAIEAELSCKTRSAYQRILAENSARYDAIVYFCAPNPGRLLRRIGNEEDWPKLVIRDLPGTIPQDRRPRREAKRNPTAKEKAAMRLISEQGAVRLDQLARFLDCNPEAIEELAARLCAGNFATRHAFLAGEPQWIALTWVGNRLADTPLDWFRPRPGGVRHWLALNELRLYIRQCSPNAEWLSRRLLLKTHGRTAKVPGAEVRLGGKRFAINYRLTPNNGRTLVPRTDLQNDAYDAVIFFCATPRTRLFMERLQKQHRWSKVAVRDMPDPELIASESREVERLVDSLLEP